MHCYPGVSRQRVLRTSQSTLPTPNAGLAAGLTPSHRRGVQDDVVARRVLVRPVNSAPEHGAVNDRYTAPVAA